MFSTFFDIAQDHTANASKDRTGLFDGQYFIISPDTGARFYQWLSSGDMSKPVAAPAPTTALERPIAELVDEAVKAYCQGLGNDEKAVVTADIKRITGGTVNYKNITDEAVLKRIYEHFTSKEESV